jgi:hypothetical protein
MITIHLNGLRLIPGIDFTAGNNTVSFTQPPCMGDDIVITTSIPGSSTSVYMQKLTGNGHTFRYNIDSTFDERAKLQRTLEDAWTYQSVPAVADVLKRLQVVLELVKQDDPLHQR